MNQEGGGKLRLDQKAILEYFPKAPLCPIWAAVAAGCRGPRKGEDDPGARREIDDDAIFEEVAPYPRSCFPVTVSISILTTAVTASFASRN